METASIHLLTQLMKAERYAEALGVVVRLLEKNRASPYLLQTKADLIQLQDNSDAPPLDEVEQCLLQAHRMNPNDSEIIEDLAHYYDAVSADDDKAKQYATLYLKKIDGGMKAMKKIIDGEE
jgi:predicted Zn-dependent protease